MDPHVESNLPTFLLLTHSIGLQPTQKRHQMTRHSKTWWWWRHYYYYLLPSPCTYLQTQEQRERSLLFKKENMKNKISRVKAKVVRLVRAVEEWVAIREFPLCNLLSFTIVITSPFSAKQHQFTQEIQKLGEFAHETSNFFEALLKSATSRWRW